MSVIANQIRNIHINRHVEIMLLGDPAKLLLLPMWARSTVIPDVHQAVYEEYRCNIWCVDQISKGPSGPVGRMFPMDGTINTGFDYCIVVYDTITRMQQEPLEKWLAIKDQICLRQHPDRKCQTIVIVLKTPRTSVTAYEHISQTACRLKIHLITVDNTSDGFDKIRTLVERLSGLIYIDRKAQYKEIISKLTEIS